MLPFFFKLYYCGCDFIRSEAWDRIVFFNPYTVYLLPGGCQWSLQCEVLLFWLSVCVCPWEKCTCAACENKSLWDDNSILTRHTSQLLCTLLRYLCRKHTAKGANGNKQALKLGDNSCLKKINLYNGIQHVRPQETSARLSENSTGDI